MIAWFRIGWRLCAVGIWLLWGAVLAALFVRIDAHHAYTPRQLGLVRWWSGKLLTMMGVRLSVRGQIQSAPVWVSNHISWLDIVVLMAVAPSRFLSKAEVASWPLIGWLAQRAGTVFIRRGNGETEVVVQQLKQLITLGDRVLFFPEGTSSVGEPLRFHARLFSLPIAMQVDVAPIALVYRDSDVCPREDLGYVGEQTFMQGLLHLLAQRDVVAEVNLLPQLITSELTRNALSQAAEQAVKSGWHELVAQ
jgi:1-acyl-sn-glycerol-3-phosphate acyltransferase